MSNSVLNRSLLLAGLICLGAPVAGCNTVKGAGQDVQNTGEVIEHTADEVGDDIDAEMGEDGN